MDLYSGTSALGRELICYRHNEGAENLRAGGEKALIQELLTYRGGGHYLI